SGGGEVFYIGNGPYANGAYIVPPWVRSSPKYEHEDFRKKARELTGRDLSRAEASRFWWREGLKAILADPLRWIRLEARKALLFLNDHELPDNYSYGSFLRFSRVLPWLPTFGPVLALACAGLAAAATRPRGGAAAPKEAAGTSLGEPGAADLRDLLPLLLAGAAYMASVMLFFNFGRFRLPVLPILFVLAGAGAVAIVGAVAPRHLFFDIGRTHLARTRSREGSRTPPVRSRLPRAALLVALAACVFAVSRIDLHSEAEEPFQDRLHLAAAWRKAGRLDEAEEILRLTIREAGEILARRGWRRGDPAVPGGVTFALSLHTAHRDLAGVLLERGRNREAIDELRAALPLDPNDAAVYRLLGGALLAEGDLAEAESILRRGLLVEPASFTMRFDLATALYESGRPLEALEELREAAARNPALGDLDRADWHYGMGVVLLTLPGEEAEALEHLEEALALNPSHPHASEARAEIDRRRR
ncbi:MAG: tetratricopeptide repeat protein, partial [Planctomycetes bacterium]|nr:tetratricopeptide repeat protein [Planctomycetota bacterium]